MWTYAFLPILLALFVKTVTTAVGKDSKELHKNIIYFSLMSVVAFSFASINAANLALIVIALAILAVFYLIKFRGYIHNLTITFAKIAALVFPLNLWWIIPILNYYFLSPDSFNGTVNVGSWSWTHVNASFLNLFWLNGFWAWLQEYVPFIGRLPLLPLGL